MRDAEGFLIPCKYCDWKIIDERDNHDFVCEKFARYNTGYHICYGDENCKYYEPCLKGEINENNIGAD